MKKKNVLTIIMAIAFAIVILLGVFHQAVYQVFRNVTVKTYKLEDQDTWTNGKIYKNIRYADISEADYLDLYVPDGEKSPELFVIIHGGGFIAGDADTKQAKLMYRFFRDRGYACASVNYRLAQEAEFPAAIEDCKAAIRFLKANAEEYGYNADKVTVFGESAGGYLALMCAVTGEDEFNSVPFIGQTDANNPSSRVDVLVDYYGYTDIDSLNGDLKKIGVPKLVYALANNWMIGNIGGYEDYASYWFRKNISDMGEKEKEVIDPYYYIKKNEETVLKLSVWMIHGDCDITIPYLSSERLYEYLVNSMGKNNVEFRLEPDMGHASDPLYSEEILSEIDNFIRKQEVS